MNKMNTLKKVLSDNEFLSFLRFMRKTRCTRILQSTKESFTQGYEVIIIRLENDTGSRFTWKAYRTPNVDKIEVTIP